MIIDVIEMKKHDIKMCVMHFFLSSAQHVKAASHVSLNER